MLEPKNVYNCVQPIFYVSNIFGLAPFIVTRNGCRTSSLASLWNICILISFGSCAVYALFVRDAYLDLRGLLTEITDVFTVCFSTLNLIVCISGANLCKYKIMSIIHRLYDVDQQFLKMGAMCEINKKQKHIIVYQICTIIFILLFTCYTIYSDFGSFIIVVTPERVTTIFSYDVPLVISLYIDLQFCVFLYLLKIRFSILNRIFRNINMKKIELQYVTTITGNNHCDIHKSSKNILDVRMLHFELTTICAMVNEAYNLQLLTMSLQAFVILTANIFYWIREFISGLFSVPVEYILYSSTVIPYGLIQLIVVVLICSGTTNEANKTGSLLNNNTSYTKQSRKQIMHFSGQLVHNKVQFTACNLFALNYQFIAMIVATITSYLVIIIQFEMTYHKNYNKNNSI